MFSCENKREKGKRESMISNLSDYRMKEYIR